MIRTIRFANYKSCGDVRLDLQPLTLLVGPAGSGKSNLLKGIVFLQNTLRRETPEELFAGLGAFHLVRSRWAQETDAIGVEVKVAQLDGYPETVATYIVRFADSPGGVYVLEETLRKTDADGTPEWVFQRYASSGKKPTIGREFGTVHAHSPTILRKCFYSKDVDRSASTVKFAHSVARSLSSIGYYHLEVSELKALSSSERDRIGYYGEDLPGFIAWVQREQPETYDSLLAAMKELLPGLERIIVTQLDQSRLGLALSFQGHRGHIAAPDLSDGTVLTLGLLSVLNARNRPQLLAIEEPETGLHPRRLRWLFDHLVSLAYPRTNESATQVLLTSHSPYLVNFFGDMPESVFIVELRSGETRVKPFSAVQETLRDPSATEGIGFKWATGLFEGL